MAKDVARVRNFNISSIRLYFIVLDSLGMELMFLYTKVQCILSMILLKCHSTKVILVHTISLRE